MPDNDLRLFALDGGGVRGLSSLIILQKLMATVNSKDPPKPCEYFDMIGGTSTGGLIAIMLGRLKMSVEECIDAYTSLSDKVFEKQRHRVTVKGKIQGRFNTAALERAVKQILVKQGLAEDELLKDSLEAACKVLVCATSKQTGNTVCLTSYQPPRGSIHLVNSAKIWEACRATSAATSFFDPIAIGPYEEEFVDGALGANNPVYALWGQAQDVWGADRLQDKLKCLVSIGTGVPSLKPFRDDIFHIGDVLVKLATETEQTAEQFHRDKSSLGKEGRYYRFNVLQGLEDVGLEESKKKKEIAAATGRYIMLQDVFEQMKSCANNLSGREYFGYYKTHFSLQGMVVTDKFVDRPLDTIELEHALLPQQHNRRQKIFVLYGLGGIGKTQLAVEFARRHHPRFSSVFWLDGRSEDNLKQSISNCARRIPEGQISDESRNYILSGGGNIDTVVTEVMDWLGRPDNTNWLLIFDNIDRDYQQHSSEPGAYDISRYFPGDQGSILITTRLSQLAQLGDSRRLNKVDESQSRAIFQKQYGASLDSANSKELLSLLDGLPLALAQAAAYLRESGLGFSSYIRYYKQQWKDLMESHDRSGFPLLDYPERSVLTTWTISFNAIKAENEAATNLLLLWAFLNNKDLWHGLFHVVTDSTEHWPEWLRVIAANELRFVEAIKLLQNYSLIERLEDLTSYTTHPVVHRWASCILDDGRREEFMQLAMMVVGLSIPYNAEKDYWVLQRRLLPHADSCSHWILTELESLYHREEPSDKKSIGGVNNISVLLAATDRLGTLYADQGKLNEAEEMYQRALKGYEKALGPDHTSILDTVHNIGNLYTHQGKLKEAEEMYQRALKGWEKALGPDHISTLYTVHNLGSLYKDQGKLKEAEEIYQRALKGIEKALGPDHTSTLETVNSLGNLYRNQGKLKEAEEMYQRALKGTDKALGPDHTSTLGTVNNLGILYVDQGKLNEAEEMYQRALKGTDKALGPDHTSTLDTVHNIGNLYSHQGKLKEAEEMYQRALKGYEKALGPDHISTLETVYNLGTLYTDQGKLKDAEEMFLQALVGFQTLLGPSHQRCKVVTQAIHSLHQWQGVIDGTSDVLVHKESFKRTLKDKVSSRLRKVFK